MRGGDTFKIILSYTVDGSPIAKDQFDDLEFTIGGVSYKLSDGSIVWDDLTSKYVINLTQAESFRLEGDPDYQLRVKLGDNVTASDISNIHIERTLSHKII